MQTDRDLPEANRILDIQRIAREVANRSIQKKHRDDLEEKPYTARDFEGTVEELEDLGVKLEHPLVSETPHRRVVYTGMYQNEPVVVKFASSKFETYANIREKTIYEKASADGLDAEFAKVFFMTSDTHALVQELCTHFRVVEDWQKPRDRWFAYNATIEAQAIDPHTGKVDFKKLSGRPLDTPIKYKMYEIQMGKNKKGKWVYVDYGS